MLGTFKTAIKQQSSPWKCLYLSLSASGSESEASPEKRVRVGESSEESQRGPKQKNRRRCHRCQTKLELVQQELGSCRCGQCLLSGIMKRIVLL